MKNWNTQPYGKLYEYIEEIIFSNKSNDRSRKFIPIFNDSPEWLMVPFSGDWDIEAPIISSSLTGPFGTKRVYWDAQSVNSRTFEVCCHFHQIRYLGQTIVFTLHSREGDTDK